MTKLTVCEERTVIRRYEECSRDKLVEILDLALSTLSEFERSSATFGVEHEYSYGDDIPVLRMSWYRHETKEEVAAREKVIKDALVSKEDQDFKKYLELKKRFDK